MNVHFDIIGSFLLGSLLLLMILTFNNDLVEFNNKNNMYLIAQNRGAVFRDILEDDLKKIALGVPDSTSAFLIADSINIKFKVDLDLDGSINDVHYYLDSTDTASRTENPNDVVLYRKVDSNPAETFSIGLLSIRFDYYNSFCNSTTTLADIKYVKYQFYLENRVGYNGYFSGAYFTSKIKPKNIN